MIDISSLPEYELAGLEGFEAKELYKVVRNAWFNDQDYEILWDQDSNCDDGFSIITYPDYGDQWCFDYAIEKVPLWYKP